MFRYFTEKNAYMCILSKNIHKKKKNSSVGPGKFVNIKKWREPSTKTWGTTIVRLCELNTPSKVP